MFLELSRQTEADAKERTLLGALQKFIKEHKLEELPILEEANKRMAQLEQQSAERKRAVSAAAAAAREVSKNIQKQQLLQSAKRPKLPENVVQGSLGQNIGSVETLGQQLMSRQIIHSAGVANQYQVASSQNILPAFTQSPQLVAGSQHLVGIQNQALLAPSIQTRLGGLADYYGLASTRSYRPDSPAPRPSVPNVPSAYTSSRSKLYSADPLAAVSRASDKKGSSYNYSLSNMSTYNHR